MWIASIPPEDATGILRELYDEDERDLGHVATHTLVFGLHPEPFERMRLVTREVRSKMPLRRYELIQLAVSLAVECPTCTVVHGALLRRQVFGPDEMRRILADFRCAGLEASEVAIMSYAQKLSGAGRPERGDVEALRYNGLSDTEILDITMAAAARNFFTRIFNALGVEPEPAYLDGLEDDLAAALLGGGGDK